MYKVVMFDLDGTLIDTLPAIANAFNKTLKMFGCEQFLVEDYKKFIGEGFIGVYKKLKNVLNFDISSEEFLEKVRKIYEEEIFYNVKMYDDMDKVLDYLVSKNVILAIVTNKDHDFAISHYNKYLNKWKFKYIYGKKRKLTSKAWSICYKKILELEKLNEDQVVIIGDMIIDQKTADNANISHIHCSYGYEIRNIEAKLVVNNAVELLNVLSY